jgi:hypothetical protein
MIDWRRHSPYDFISFLVIRKFIAVADLYFCSGVTSFLTTQTSAPILDDEMSQIGTP